MRKSVRFLTAAILLFIALVAFWNAREAHVVPTTAIVKQNVAHAGQAVVRTFPLPVAHMPQSAIKPELQVLQVGVRQSAKLQRLNVDWMNTHGCNNAEYFIDSRQSESTLRSWTLNNDLTTANRLAWMLLFMDTSHDGRPEAKKVLWQAILQGSVCAITTYDIFWRRAATGKREITHSQGKSYVHYLLAIPQTDAAKRQALMNDYAWDLVYEMRAGVPPLGPGSFGTYESWYHFKFQPTAAEYAYACQRANDLYESLQSDREAQDLGPFDNTPQPLTLRFGTMGKPAVGIHCSHWPVPRQAWQAAEFHLVQHDGTITSFPLWVVKSDLSTSAE